MAKKDNKEKNKKVNGKNFIAKNRIIVGVVMLICAIVLGVFILPNMGRSTEYTIYTVSKSIPSGTIISTNMLTTTKTSDKILAERSVTEKAAKVLGEYVAKYDLQKGSYLLWSDIVKSDGTGGTDIVPAGKQIISVPITSIYSSVSYTLAKNDIIRFYSTYEDEKGETLAYIPSNLCYVEIYDVYDSSGISSSISGGAPSSISLIVTEAQALDIVTLTNTSKVYYSLISSGDEEKATAYLAIQEKILNGEIDVNEDSVDLSNIDLSGAVDDKNENNNKPNNKKNKKTQTTNP